MDEIGKSTFTQQLCTRSTSGVDSPCLDLLQLKSHLTNVPHTKYTIWIKVNKTQPTVYVSKGINEATPAKVNDDVFLEEFIVVTLR